MNNDMLQLKYRFLLHFAIFVLNLTMKLHIHHTLFFPRKKKQIFPFWWDKKSEEVVLTNWVTNLGSAKPMIHQFIGHSHTRSFPLCILDRPPMK